MSNQLGVNKTKIYDEILTNLSLTVLNQNSTVYKIVQPIVDELESFVPYVNSLLKEMYISTASLATLQKIGTEYGIYRKTFNTLNLSKDTLAVKLGVRDENILSEGTLTNIQLFKQGDKVQINNVQITFLEDVYYTQYVTTYLSVKLDLINSSSILLPSGSLFTIKPLLNTTIISNIDIEFVKNIGLVSIQESIADYRTRLLQSRYLKYRDFNTVLKTILLETPGITNSEIDKGIDSSFNTVYLYTDKLIKEGEDFLLDSTLIPAAETSLKDLINWETSIVIKPATPLQLVLNVTGTLKNTTESIRTKLNDTLVRVESINQELIDSLLLSIGEDLKYTVKLKSKSIYETDTEFSILKTIEKPKGRFFYITTITSI